MARTRKTTNTGKAVPAGFVEITAEEFNYLFSQASKKGSLHITCNDGRYLLTQIDYDATWAGDSLIEYRKNAGRRAAIEQFAEEMVNVVDRHISTFMDEHEQDSIRKGATELAEALLYKLESAK